MAVSGRINGLSLFSGIGGLDLALRDWVRPIAYCEIDPDAQRALLFEMARGNLPWAPIWDDVTTLGREQFCFFQGSPTSTWPIDLIYGGFPCQDISIAGLGKGLAGERSGLVFEVFRLCRKLGPHFVFLENVPVVTSRGGLEIVGVLAEMGYDCRWCVISAWEAGAPLKESARWFLLAKANRQGWQGERSAEETRDSQPAAICQKPWVPWEIKPGPDCALVGLPRGMGYLYRLYGNAVCPEQVRMAFQILMFGRC